VIPGPLVGRDRFPPLNSYFVDPRAVPLEGKSRVGIWCCYGSQLWGDRKGFKGRLGKASV